MSGGLATDLNEADLVRDVRHDRWRQLRVPAGNTAKPSSELVALALERTVPGGLCSYTHRLLGPLGITVDHWHVNQIGGATGRAYAFLTPRELARFGQLVLQRGEWDGTQLIPAGWFDTMLSLGSTSTAARTADREPAGWRGAQGVRPPLAHLRSLGSDRLDRVRLRRTVFGRHPVVGPGDGGHSRHIPGRPDADPAPPLTACVPRVVRHARDGRRSDRRCGLRPRPRGGARERRRAACLAPHAADDYLAEWSPDGSRLAFVSGRDLNAELYVVDRDGSHLERLTFDWASDNVPRWSPDGTRIGFLSDRDAGSHEDRVDSDVHVLDLASRVVHRVSPGLGDASGFAWSPDGERIVFVRSPDRDGLGPLWAVDADGAGRRCSIRGPVGWPSWSPDGTTLVVYTGPGDDPRAPLEIGLLDLASGAVTALGGGADRPTWTGDGHPSSRASRPPPGSRRFSSMRDPGNRPSSMSCPPDGRHRMADGSFTRHGRRIWRGRVTSHSDPRSRGQESALPARATSRHVRWRPGSPTTRASSACG